MRRVLTVHGVGFLGERGQWQDSIEWVVAPHFNYKPITYSHYRWLGLIFAVIELWMLPGGALAYVAAKTWGTHPHFWLWLIVVFFGLLSLVAPPLRRSLATRKVAKESSTSFTQRPHIIAHSMGTQIVGAALRKRPSFRASRIVLAGCVLPVDFPWAHVYQSNRFAFTHVRNEVAKGDRVPLMAEKISKTRFILRGFGAAGQKGFDGASGFVHNIENPNLSCTTCDVEVAIPSIHNVRCPFGHSDALERDHVALFLLPWLWGIEPPEYTDWLEFCLTANARRKEAGNGPPLLPAEELLLRFPWRWITTVETEGLFKSPISASKANTLKEYIENVIASYPKKMGQADPFQAILVLRELCSAVAEASRAHISRGHGWKKTIKALHPAVAVLHAVVKCLDQNANIE